MRTAQKKRLDNLLELMQQAHGSIEKMAGNNRQNAAVLLEECQSAAITIGRVIDESVGEGTAAVKRLEEYCETVFAIHEELLSNANAEAVADRLNKCCGRVRSACRSEVKAQKLAVFLPYKACMWDSLESVWKRYDADPEWEALVVPIPYYDKNPDGSFGDYHYEGCLYPEGVPVVDYRDYDLKEQHPDEIYIHNPYDEANYVTSVHPMFYSKELANDTDKLIYIPYFVLGEPDPNNADWVETVSHFAQAPGVFHADEVIVQSENMRQCYIEALVRLTGEHTREKWGGKIKGAGSPKFEKIVNTDKNDLKVPKDWQRKIYRADGSAKKVILYNTGVSALLQESELMIEKIAGVLSFFKKREDDMVLLWRPHPLIKATISSMRPALWAAYNSIVEQYRADDFGIYDDSAELDRAIALADAYYGDESSVVHLCQSVKVPVMIQNVRVKNR